MKYEKIVFIEWEDSGILSVGWHEHEMIDRVSGTVICHTAGFVVKEDAAFLSIACSQTPDEAQGTLAIPRGAIKRMVYLMEAPTSIVPYTLDEHRHPISEERKT